MTSTTTTATLETLFYSPAAIPYAAHVITQPTPEYWATTVHNDPCGSAPSVSRDLAQLAVIGVLLIIFIGVVMRI